MLNWIVWNRTDFCIKMDLALQSNNKYQRELFVLDRNTCNHLPGYNQIIISKEIH